jgi:adenylate kinase
MDNFILLLWIYFPFVDSHWTEHSLWILEMLQSTSFFVTQWTKDKILLRTEKDQTRYTFHSTTT